MGLVKTRRLAAMQKRTKVRRRKSEKAVRGVRSFWYTLPVLPMVGAMLRMESFQ